MEEKVVKMPDGFEIHIVNPDKEVSKKPVTEEEVFLKMLEKYEKE